MKNITNRIVVLLVVGAVMSALALGKTTRKEVTFADAVTVNGTMIKSGVYEVAFDDQTNQLTINKSGKVIATADARVEKVEGNGRATYVTRADPNDATKPPVVLSISLKHGNQATIVSSSD